MLGRLEVSSPGTRTSWRRRQSAANPSLAHSLLTGKNTGNVLDFGASGEFWARIPPHFRPVARQFPAHANREFLRPNREVFWPEQGITENGTARWARVQS